MARKRKKKKPSYLADLQERWGDVEPETKQRWILRGAKGGCLLCLMFVCAFSLLNLEERLLASAEFQGPASIRLVNVPEHLNEQMAAALEQFSDVRWSESTLCERIAEAMMATGWVRQVERVRRRAGGAIDVSCAYRSPVAMVATDRGNFLVDVDCVRLPGRYRLHESIKLIHGVSSAAPAPGEVWGSSDLRAGVALVRLLDPEDFNAQIAAIAVGNYGGRLDSREAHIFLTTDSNQRIIWGSEPGQEVEENTAAQKIALLRENFRRFGHVVAGHPWIDVSVHPDRINAPA